MPDYAWVTDSRLETDRGQVAAQRLGPIHRRIPGAAKAKIKLIAYLIGDGHLSIKSPSDSYFCNSDPQLIEDFNQCCYELFGSFAPIDTQQLHPNRKSVSYVRISGDVWLCDVHIARLISEGMYILAGQYQKAKVTIISGSHKVPHCSYDGDYGYY